MARQDAGSVCDYGNIYVLGMGPGPGAGSDIIVFKVTSTGQFAWSNVERRYDHDQLDDVPAVIIHYGDEIYVAGTVTSGSTGKDFVVIKWDLNGNIADGPETFDADDAGLEDTLADMVVGAVASPGQGVDHSGVWVTGSSYRGATAGYNYATMHYTFDLEPVDGWPRYFDRGLTGGNDNAAAMALGNHKVYVTGTSSDALGVGDYATVAYQRDDGTDGWPDPVVFDGDGNGHDDARRIAFEPSSDRVAVTGKSWGGAVSKFDAVTALIIADDSTAGEGGAAGQSRVLDGGVQRDDEGLDIIVDPFSDPPTFLVTGRYFQGSFSNFFTDRMNADGSGAWSAGPITFDGWGYHDHGFAVRTGPDQTIEGVTHRAFFVLGRTMDIETVVRSGLVKYVEIP